MLGLTEPLLLSYALIVVRLSAALVVMPMFGGPQVPPHTKVGLALFMGLIIVPLQGPVELAPGMGPLAVTAAGEAVVGLAVGFAVVLVFQGLEMAGGLIGLQLGMGLGEVLDPITGAQSTEFRRFYSVLAMLIFFLANAHHAVIRGLFATFDLIPLTMFNAESLSLPALIQLSAALFVVAVRIALPVMGALFVADLGLALVARTMPQLNVLIVGLPIKIGLGLFVLMAALPTTTHLMEFTFGGILDNLALLLTPTTAR